MRGDPRQDRLDLGEELLRPGRGSPRAEARADRPARVVDEDPLRAGLGARDLPGVLVAGVGVRVPVVAERVPVAVGELDVELRVRAHPELLDRRHLQRLEAGFRVVHRAEDGEGEREHDLVGRDRRRPHVLLERQRERAAGVLLDRGELHPHRDLPGEAVRELPRHLVVPAVDVVFLVRLPERVELALADEAEQVDQVERALDARLGAVLDVVGDVEHAAEFRLRPAVRAGLVEPLDDRHPVELEPALGERVPERRIAGSHGVLVQLLVDPVQVGDEL